MTIESDIERIARLRGRDPANYQREAKIAHLDPRMVNAIFSAPRDGDADVDMLIYDILPPESRALLREATVHIHAERYAKLLDAVEGDQDTLARAVNAALADYVQRWLLRHYGHRHPNLKENRL